MLSDVLTYCHVTSRTKFYYNLFFWYLENIEKFYCKIMRIHNKKFTFKLAIIPQIDKALVNIFIMALIRMTHKFTNKDHQNHINQLD